MAEQDFCHTCIQRHDCQEVYHAMGNSRGPSVTLKVSLAFLLPLVVFIISLALFEKILGGAAGTVQAAVALAMALLSAFSCVFVVRKMSGEFSRNR